MIIKQLIGICQCFILRNLVEGVNRFLPLLKIIVVDRRNDKKLGKRIVQPKCFVPVGKEVAFFADTFHAAKRTVPVIIIFFVHCRPLADFHQPDISNQEFEFILCQLIVMLPHGQSPYSYTHKNQDY